jgi:hypothetical protein
MVAALAILALSGCVQMVKVESGQVTIRDTLMVTLDSARNRFEAPGIYLHVASGAHEIWTADGVPLDVIAFFVGVGEGQTLGAPLPQREKKLPSFRATMSPHEVVELYEALMTQDGSAFKLVRLAPAQFAGVQGFRFEHVLTTRRDSLQLSGVAYGVVVSGRLYLVAYTAPKTYYFSKHLPGFEAIVRSAQIRVAQR